MSYKSKRILFSIVYFFIIVLAFVLGSALVSKYAIIREMQLHEEILIGNLPIFTHCKISECDDTLQQLLVQKNDDSIQKYAALEGGLKENIFTNIVHDLWPIIFLYFYDLSSITSSDQLRHHYIKIDCGLRPKGMRA